MISDMKSKNAVKYITKLTFRMHKKNKYAM